MRGLSKEAKEPWPTGTSSRRWCGCIGEGEGAPYTGLKPAEAVEPVIAASDKALESGSVDELTQEITQLVAEGIRQPVRRGHGEEASTPRRTSRRAGSSSRSYVEFTHYVERLHTDAISAAPARACDDEAGGKSDISTDASERTSVIRRGSPLRPLRGSDLPWAWYRSVQGL